MLAEEETSSEKENYQGRESRLLKGSFLLDDRCHGERQGRKMDVMAKISAYRTSDCPISPQK